MLPDSIDWNRPPRSPHYDKHLFVEEDGKFRVELGTWEKEVLADDYVALRLSGGCEISTVSGSLEVPYRDSGEIKPAFPDLVIVRQDSKGFAFDILEPHDPSRKDNAVKAVGFAEFAERHWALFGRIQMIRKKKAPNGKEAYFRLDVGKESVRKRVLAISSNGELDQIFEQEADAK